MSIRVIIEQTGEKTCKYAIRTRLCGRSADCAFEVDAAGGLWPAGGARADLTRGGQQLATLLANVNGVVRLTFQPYAVIVEVGEPGLFDWETEIHPVVLDTFRKVFGTEVVAS